MQTKALAVPSLCLCAMLGAVLTSPTAPATRQSASYEIRITNLTRGQVFSPPVVAVHSDELQPLWTLGSPASDELALVAEDAINDPLVAKLDASPHVSEVRVIATTNGPIPPGATAVGVLSATPGKASRLSLVGMLVTTNDAFYGLNGIELPKHGSSSHVAVAYDAGSEVNTENCAHIPGPPCGKARVRVTAGAEGFVHVHAGIHGIATLDDARFDWRNPVAHVEIRRLR